MATEVEEGSPESAEGSRRAVPRHPDHVLLLAMSLSAACLLALVLSLIFSHRYAGLVRDDLLATAIAMHRHSQGPQPSDLVMRFCESAISRANLTVDIMQVLLAGIAAGAVIAMVRSHLAAREFRDEHNHAIGRAEVAQDRAESRLRDMERLVARSEAVAADSAQAAQVAKRELGEIAEAGRHGIEEMRKAAAELLERVQAEAEQRVRAAEEMARQRPADAQQPTGGIGRQERWALAQVLLSVGNLERGAELLERVVLDDLAADSLDVNVLNQLSGLLDRLGRYADAAKYADIAIAKFPGDVAAPFNKAVSEIHLGATAPNVAAKRDHWGTALRSFGAARRLHAAGARMTDADYGKMWLFAGETAEYIAGVEPTPMRRADFIERAGAWYADGDKWLSDSYDRATERTYPIIDFWSNNASERCSKLLQLDKAAATRGLQRHDIARLDNEIPFWPDEDDAQENDHTQDTPS